MGFTFWGPKKEEQRSKKEKGPERTQSDLTNKLQDPRIPVVSIIPLAVKDSPFLVPLPG